MPHVNVTNHRSADHFGTRLKKRREGFELSIADVSASTNLREDYITAIESLNEAALPAIGYTLGFVRTYAQALGMDGNVAVKDYKADVALTGLPLRDAPHFIFNRTLRLPRGFVSAISVIAVFAMIGTWYATHTDANASPSLIEAAALTDYDAVIPAAPLMQDGVLTLRTSAPTWVKITDSQGTTLVSRIFVTGETWQGPADGGYSLSLRDAGAVELYDGTVLMAPLGQRGHPVDNLILSRELPPLSDVHTISLHEVKLTDAGARVNETQ